MIFRPLVLRIGGLLLLSGTCAGTVASQEMRHLSTATVLRQQWGSLAQEVVDKLRQIPHGPVIVWIQPVADSILAQNAFLETLQRRGYSPTLSARNDSTVVRLTVAVLTDRKQVREISKEVCERTVETEIEARAASGDGQDVEMLGVFHRLLVDTVSSTEAENPLSIPLVPTDEHASVFQRFVGPLIVLASAIIVVYLFFTVRS